MVPLGWALRTGGHEVQVASRPAFAETINQTGFVAVAVGGDEGATAGDRLSDPAATTDLVAYAELWHPAAVIWDESVAVGAEVAGAVGALSVRMLGMFDPIARDAEEVADHLTVDCLPPSLRAPGEIVGRHRSVRYVPYDGPAVLPTWLRRKPRRRRILLATATADIGAVLAAIGGVDAEVICAADRVPPDVHLPDNVRLLEDLPLTAVLPSCSAVVHDGTALPALASLVGGLPQLAVVDEPAAGLAQRIAGQGAGLLWDASGSPTGHIERLLTDTSLREHAERLRAELAATPSPGDLVPDLVDLVGSLG
jgi:UDP:flavonoid glycosyltransferase YjiC (YdhE family)